GIGAPPSARLGACLVVGDGAFSLVTFVAGTVLVNVKPNSTTTTNGRAAEPSGVDLSPFAGSAPNDVITACASAPPPPSAGARYFSMNADAAIGCFCDLSSPPNETVSSIGPTSNVAVPWKSGPATSMRAPRLIEIVSSP